MENNDKYTEKDIDGDVDTSEESKSETNSEGLETPTETPAEITQKNGDDVVNNFSAFLKEKDSRVKDKKVPLFAVIISVLLAVLITFMATFALLDRKYKSDYNDFIRQNMQSDYYTLETVKSYFAEYYIGDISSLTEEEITDALIRAYISKTGDAYAYYWNEEEYELYSQQTNGAAVGIGILMGWDDEQQNIKVYLVYPDSPADKAGIKSGDRIVAVDGERVSEIGYDKAAEKSKGEKGTELKLTVSRDNSETELTAIRGEFKTLSVVSNMLSDGKTALMRILDFDATTVEQFAKQYLELKEQGIAHFVFDLRDNPGGQLNSVLGVLSFLLGDGVPVLEAADKSGEKVVTDTDRAYYCTDDYSSSVENSFKHTGKTVVLINGGTASAAELFTAAMHENNVDVITVGNTTYGKGVMQRLYPLPNGGVVKITYSTYTAPGVENYDGKGIDPDVECDMSEESKNENVLILSEEDDDQLQRALQILYGQIIA